MTTLREAAQQALEALEGVVSAHAYESGTPVEAITALRAALAEPVQEPVAVCEYCEKERPVIHAPRREWRGLTNDEIEDCWDGYLSDYQLQMIRAVEAKLKEKNA